MKKTMTRTTLLTLVLLFSFTIISYAQDYQLYLCGSATATLRPSLPDPTTPLVNGDKVQWFLDGVPVGGLLEYSGIGTVDIIVPADLTVGLHRYTSSILSAGDCLGDPSDAYTVYKLPTKTLKIEAGKTEYCVGDSGPSGSVITATTTPAAALPNGFEYEYDWSVTNELGTDYTPISTIGSSNGSKTAENIFTMTVTDAGTYVFNAKVKYVYTGSGVFKSGDNKGCEVSATATQQVIVTPKPDKPTISLVN